MTTCTDLAQARDALAAQAPTALPAAVRAHLAACPACARALAAARLARGLLAAAAAGPAPPPAFAAGVRAALPARPRPAADLWRPAWGLVPAFAATAALLFLLFQASGVPGTGGLLPTEGLSAGERLVLGARPVEPATVLAAVLEDGR